MSLFDFIKIDKSKCIKCLQCLRSCHVNAIRYVDQELFIHPERCVKCGDCYEYCSYNAVEIKNEVRSAQLALDQNETVIASLSPTWVSEFKGVSMNQIICALKGLGFTHVSQATLGAEKVVEETRKNFSKKNKLTISSLCPVVNRLIETYYPHHLKHMNPISMPETLHTRMLKQWYGEEAKVVYISSCVATIGNVVLDGVLTYSLLKELFEEKNIDIYSYPKEGENDFQPSLASNYHGYQMVSSAIEYFPNIDVQSASGLKRVMKMLEDIEIEDFEDKVYLELFACEGGCLTSVGSIDKNNMLAKKLRFDKHIREGRNIATQKLPEVEFHIQRVDRGIKRYAKEKEKEFILRKMNISKSGSLLNCGACGYLSCDAFANAVVLNMAEIKTCVWHQKNSIKQNLDSIIEQIPYGFFIIDKDLRFKNVNDTFCQNIEVDKKTLLSNKVTIDKILSFDQEIDSMFKTSFKTSNKNTTHEVMVCGNNMKLNLVALQEGELIFGTLRNFFSSTAFDDEYIESVKNIIRENVISVQKIAYLLGDNISRTENLLSTIVKNDEE